MARIIDLERCDEIKQHCDYCNANCGYTREDILMHPNGMFAAKCPHCGNFDRIFPPKLWVNDIKKIPQPKPE